MRELSLLALIVGLLTSCIEERDSEKPVVSIISPSQNEIVYTADDLHILAELSDNRGILQYKIVLSGIDSLNDIAADTTYSVIYIDAIQDNAAQHSFDLTLDLPDSTFNGHYQLTMACVDVEGNQSYSDTVLLEIRNSFDSQPPVFNVTGPVPYDTLGFGEGFVLGGTVSDDMSLNYSEIFIGRTNFSDTVSYVSFPWITDNQVDYTNVFNWWNQVDSTWSQGAYHVYYTAWDNYSGVSHSIPFYVKY